MQYAKSVLELSQRNGNQKCLILSEFGRENIWENILEGVSIRQILENIYKINFHMMQFATYFESKLLRL